MLFNDVVSGFVRQGKRGMIFLVLNLKAGMVDLLYGFTSLKRRQKCGGQKVFISEDVGWSVYLACFNLSRFSLANSMDGSMDSAT